MYVNIYDVLDADKTIRAGGKARPQRFPTPRALTDYTVRTERMYPRHNVIEGEPDYAMLRHILDPQLEEKLQREKEERLRKKKEAKARKKKEAKLRKKDKLKKEKQEKQEKQDKLKGGKGNM